MFRFMHLFCLTLLILVQPFALAQARTGMAGQIVICTGAGPVSISVDADEAPGHAPHDCPDCLQDLTKAFAAATFTLRPEFKNSSAPILVFVSLLGPELPDLPPARGPPNRVG